MEPTYAGFWRRFLAESIDNTILIILVTAVEFAALGAIYWLRGLGQGFVDFAASLDPVKLQLVNFAGYAILSVPYYTWFHFRFGTTPGKRPFAITVVSHPDFRPITFRQSLVRCLAYAISYLPAGMGYVMAAFHPEKRALHDLIAGTVSLRRVS